MRFVVASVAVSIEARLVGEGLLWGESALVIVGHVVAVEIKFNKN